MSSDVIKCQTEGDEGIGNSKRMGRKEADKDVV